MKKLILILFAALIGGTGLAAERQILVATSAEADPAIRKAAQSLAGAPVFEALARCGAATSARPVPVASESLLPDSAFQQAAYNHLVLVGLPDQDALLDKCRGHQIGLRPGAFEVLGYGSWKGDFGTVECDWNPFLYSRRVKDNPYTTVIIKISGTSVPGVLRAVEAFKQGLLNGIVPAGQGGTVTEPSLLDRKPDPTPPPEFPRQLGSLIQAGWTQPNEIEYRAYLDQAGFAPERLWRIKYLAPKALDDVSGRAWVNGLHRLAYGNAVTIAEFATPEQAAKTLAAIGNWKEAKPWSVAGKSGFEFEQPKDEAFPESYGKVRYLALGRRLYLLSVPDAELEAAVAAASKIQ